MLEGQNIAYHLGPRLLFNSLSFSLGKGEMMTIRGANGSGKTTLFRLLAGLVQPSSGQLLWNKEKITPHFQQSLLYVGHKLCLHPEGQVKGHVNLWHKLYGVPSQEIEKSLETWGLRTLLDRKISHLSQGQQKRLSLSRLLWLKRSIWLLDEPYASLDKQGKEVLDLSIKQHLSSQGIVVLSTHDDRLGTKEICL